MTFWLSVLALARLRVVAVPMVVAGVVLAALGFVVSPTVWTSDATAVLTGSPVNQSAQAGDQSQSPVINPLLNFSDSLTTTVSIVVQAMDTPEVMADLGAVDGPTSVKVTDVGPTELLGSKGPFLFVAARSTESGEAAADMARRTVDRAGLELLRRQEAVDAPPSQLISVLPVVSPSVPAANLQYRVAGAVTGFAVGALGVLGLVYWRRVRRLRARSEEPRTADLVSADVPSEHELSSPMGSPTESVIAPTNGHVTPDTPGDATASSVPGGSRTRTGPWWALSRRAATPRTTPSGTVDSPAGPDPEGVADVPSGGGVSSPAESGGPVVVSTNGYATPDPHEGAAAPPVPGEPRRTRTGPWWVLPRRAAAPRATSSGTVCPPAEAEPQSLDPNGRGDGGASPQSSPTSPIEPAGPAPDGPVPDGPAPDGPAPDGVVARSSSGPDGGAAAAE